MSLGYGACLVRVGGILYWRCTVPERFQAALGRSEIRRSLRTPYAKEARVKAGFLNAKIKAVWRGVVADMSIDDKFREVLARKIQEWITESENELLTLRPGQLRRGREYMADGAADEIELLKEALANNDTSFVADSVAEIMADMGVNYAVGSAEYQRIAYGLLKAGLELAEVRFNKLAKGDLFWRPAPAAVPAAVPVAAAVVPAAAPAAAVPAAVPVLAFGDAVEAYLKELDGAVSLGGRHNKHGSRDKRHGLREAALIFGHGKPVNSLCLADITAYIGQLVHIPVKLDLAALKHSITDYGRTVTADRTLSLKTQKKRCEDLRRFVGWLSDHGHLGVEVANILRKKLSARGSDVDYAVELQGGTPTRPFSDDEIRRLFSPGQYLKILGKKDGHYWGPLISLFSGYRMGEILTMQKRDIRCTPEPLDISVIRKSTVATKGRSGVWFFDLTDTSRKSFKNIGSNRPVPIHPVLIELGFLRFVESFQPDDFLFRDCLMLRKGATDETPIIRRFQTKYTLSNGFTRFRQKLGIGRAKNETDGDKVDFHCLRNSVIDRMRDRGVSPELRCEIVGHDAARGAGVDGVHGDYSDRFSLADKLDKGIGLLDFGLLLDLEKLRRW